MGRIKTRLIKRTVKSLLSDENKKFSKDFDKNKKMVTELLEVQSKKLRNVIAGYVTKQIKARK